MDTPFEQQENKIKTLFVNTRPRKWTKKEISYREVVGLAFENPTFGDTIDYSVSYSNGEHPHTEGTLADGQSVNVVNKMIFNVTQTNRS